MVYRNGEMGDPRREEKRGRRKLKVTEREGEDGEGEGEFDMVNSSGKKGLRKIGRGI